LSDETIQKDIEIITSLGVKINYDISVDAKKFEEIKTNFDFIYIAIGAQKNKFLDIPGINSRGVIEPLEFLSAVRNSKNISLGSKIAVIGGGNTAMDVARTAKRLGGEKGHVSIIYRRTKKEMPADIDEIEAAIEEGVTLQELVAPLKINTVNGSVNSITCKKMKLGEKGRDGRRNFTPIEGTEFDVELDNLIPAIGQDIILDFLPVEKLIVDPVTFVTQIPNVYTGGDAMRGASSVILAAGDGQKVANSIIEKVNLSAGKSTEHSLRRPLTDTQVKYARREFSPYISGSHAKPELDFKLIHEPLPHDESIMEADRCLHCDDVCSVCTTVCPNFANLYYPSVKKRYTIQNITPKNGSFEITNKSFFSINQEIQIINIGDFCNECGNCTTFCPTSGDPYLDKPRFYLTRDSYDSESEGYFFDNNILYYKYTGKEISLEVKDENTYYYQSELHTAEIDRSNGKIIKIELKQELDSEISTEKIITMAALLDNIKDYIPFNIQ
jgi:putative selenate reductase